MFNIDSSEFLLVAIVALVVIGPKDLPKAMRVVGYWVGKARGVSRQFRQGFDNMVREAELAEMEKRWAAENARIMAEHPATSDAEADAAAGATPTPAGQHEVQQDDPAPVMVEKPMVAPAPEPKPVSQSSAAHTSAPHGDVTPS